MFKNRQKKETAIVDEVQEDGAIKFKNKNDDPEFDKKYLNRYKKFVNENVINPGVENVEDVVQTVDGDFLVILFLI